MVRSEFIVETASMTTAATIETAETYLEGSQLEGDLNFRPISVALAQTAEQIFAGSFDSTMIGILGRRGSTKSGMCAWMVAAEVEAEAYKADKLGEPTRLMVLHNGFLRFGKQVSVRDLLAAMEDDDLWNELVGGDWITKVILAVDEVHEWFDPVRTASIVHYKLSHLIQQTRKRSVSIIWTTQKPAMVGRRLTDQTDVAIYVQSHQRPWRPWGARKEIYFDERKYAVRCDEGRSHPHCTSFPKKHTVDIKLVFQENSTVQPGTTLYGKLHCVQRFYGLWDSSKVISSNETLEMSSETLKTERAFDEMVVVGVVINELAAEGTERIVAAQFAMELANRYGVVKDANQIGKLLGNSWGLEQKRTSDSRNYVLKQVEIPGAESEPVEQPV